MFLWQFHGLYRLSENRLTKVQILPLPALQVSPGLAIAVAHQAATPIAAPAAMAIPAASGVKILRNVFLSSSQETLLGFPNPKPPDAGLGAC